MLHLTHSGGSDHYANYVPRGTKPPAGPLARSVAAILKDALKDADVSQERAGEAIGESQSQVSKYLRGDLALNVDQIQVLCDMLGLDFYRLMRDAEKRLG